MAHVSASNVIINAAAWSPAYTRKDDRRWQGNVFNLKLSQTTSQTYPSERDKIDDSISPKTSNKQYVTALGYFIDYRFIVFSTESAPN